MKICGLIGVTVIQR